MVCSNHVSLLHRFRDIITSLAYVTASDLEQSFNSLITVQMIAHVGKRIIANIIYAIFCNILDIKRFAMADMTDKVSQ